MVDDFGFSAEKQREILENIIQEFQDEYNQTASESSLSELKAAQKELADWKTEQLEKIIN